MRTSILLLGVVGASLFESLDTSPARGATGPTTPTFVLAWGNSGSALSQFIGPFGVAADAAGNVYVVDNKNTRVEKFDYLGNFITSWGSGGIGNGQFNNPFGNAIDPSGNVYVVDRNNARIQKFTSTGAYVTQWGSAGSGNGQCNQACPAADRLYFVRIASPDLVVQGRMVHVGRSCAGRCAIANSPLPVVAHDVRNAPGEVRERLNWAVSKVSQASITQVTSRTPGSHFAAGRSKQAIGLTPGGRSCF